MSLYRGQVVDADRMIFCDDQGRAFISLLATLWQLTIPYPGPYLQAPTPVQRLGLALNISIMTSVRLGIASVIEAGASLEPVDLMLTVLPRLSRAFQRRLLELSQVSKHLFIIHPERYFRWHVELFVNMENHTYPALDKCWGLRSPTPALVPYPCAASEALLTIRVQGMTSTEGSFGVGLGIAARGFALEDTFLQSMISCCSFFKRAATAAT